MTKKLFTLLILNVVIIRGYSQPDFDRVITNRLAAKVKALYPQIDHAEVVGLDYYFEDLPVVTYDLKNASYVPNDIVLDNYKFPNCTGVQQTVTENFKYTLSTKNTATFTKTEVTSNKFSFGFKIPIFSKGEISLGGETINTTTIQNGVATEKTETKEYTRNTPFTIPAQKVTLIKLVATRGTIRVPFHASCKINGRATARIFLHLKGPGIDVVKPGEPDVSFNIADVLTEPERTFNFDGYVTSENSSDLTMMYAERQVNSGECEMKEISLNKQTDESKLMFQILNKKKIKYSTADDEPKMIKINEPENLPYKLLFTTKVNKSKSKK